MMCKLSKAVSWWFAMFFIVVVSTTAPVSAEDAPLPDESVVIASTDGVDPSIGSLFGEWQGKWGGQLHSRFIVTNIESGGRVTGFYCWAAGSNFSAGCSPLPENAEFKDDEINFSWGQVVFVFQRRDNDKVIGTRTAGDQLDSVLMTKGN